MCSRELFCFNQELETPEIQFKSQAEQTSSTYWACRFWTFLRVGIFVLRSSFVLFLPFRISVLCFGLIQISLIILHMLTIETIEVLADVHCEINIKYKLKITSMALSWFFQIKKYLIFLSLLVVPLKVLCDQNETEKQAAEIVRACLVQSMCHTSLYYIHIYSIYTISYTILKWNR